MPPKKKTKQTLPTDRFLLIVESPSKCKKIEEYLGEKYQCISSKGHFRSIESLSNINIKDRFQIEFTVMADKLDCVNAMESTVKQYPAENILLATDDDREGEAIAWHICQVCSLDPLTTKRIVFHEITQPAIVAAVSNPTTINLSLVYAQQARQVLDLVVGFTISPLLWKHVSRNKKSPLSAGRCQTPALRLVHDHDCLYKSTAAGSVLWQVYATFTPHLLSFQLNTPFAKTERDALLEFLHQSRTFVHEVTVGATRDAYQSPPKPFNTSRLLQIASQTLKLSPKTTMGLAQILYQSGLITYMRTDCQKYAQVFLDKAALFIQEKYGFPYIGPLDTVVLQDATMPHEAIRCTNINMQQFQHENNQLVRLYQLIWRNTVESCMSSYRYQTTEVTVTAPQNRFYTKKIETPTFWGWQRVAGEFADTTGGGGELTDAQSAENSLLLYLKQVRGGVSWTSTDTKTVAEGRLPPHYTEASLIQKLEDMGIGRPSTFASLVETIQERGYVKKMDVPGVTVICEDFHIKREVDTLSTVVTEKMFGQEKNKLVLQPTGSLALEFLLTHFDDCFSYGYTAEMEHRLDVLASLDVAAAEQTWFLSAKEMFDIIHERSKPLVAKKPMFPLADRADYVLVFSSYGGSLKRIVDQEENSSTPKYVKIRPDMNLDIERAKRGEYTFQELAWRTDDGCLGMHEGKNLYLKKGRYGLYAEWGSNRMSMKVLENEGKDAGSISLEDVLQVIQAAQTKQEAVAFAAAHCLPNMDPHPQGPSAHSLPKSVLRNLRPDLSIRKGKFGAYIYHQSSAMKTPAFFPLKPIAKQWEQMDNNELIAWIENTYQPNA